MLYRFLHLNSNCSCNSHDAFEKMFVARDDIQQYFPKDFDPDKELEEARAERYGSIN